MSIDRMLILLLFGLCCMCLVAIVALRDAAPRISEILVAALATIIGAMTAYLKPPVRRDDE